MIPEQLLLVFAIVGVIAIAGLLLEAARQLAFLARHKHFPPSSEAIKAQETVSRLQAELQSVKAELDVQTNNNTQLYAQLQHMVDTLSKQL